MSEYRRSADAQLREREIHDRCQRVIADIRREGVLQKKEFPLKNIEAQLYMALQQPGAVLLQAETGAGKTLDIAAIVRRALPNVARIAMTEPRRDAAEGAAVGMAARHHWRFGEDVCFSTSEFKGNTDRTAVQVQTTGVLLARFKHDPMLRHYDVVIIDEAHERDLNIDLCLGLLKRANSLRSQHGLSELKLIVASATIDAKKFQQYIGATDSATFSVEGRMYPVRDHFDTSNETQKTYTTAAAERVQALLRQHHEGDILVFMPGLRTIRETVAAIQQRVGASADVLSLHGSDDMSHRSRVLAGNTSRGKRRVVVSTKMAETSVTVPGVRFVVDSCRKNQPEYDPDTGLTTLREVYASQAECTQRRGRAGRMQSGEYHPLISKEVWAQLEIHPLPEIQRSELSDIVMKMLSAGITDIEHFEFIDAPAPEHIQEALRILVSLGLIHSVSDRRLTRLGESVARLPLEPRLGTIVATAQELGCVRDAVSMASIIADGQNVVRRHSTRDEEDEAGRMLRDVDGAIAALRRERQRYDTVAAVPLQQAQSDRELSRIDRMIELLNTRRVYVQPITPEVCRELAKEILKVRQDALRQAHTSDWEMYSRILHGYAVASNKQQYCKQFGLSADKLDVALTRSARILKELRAIGVDIETTATDPRATTQCLLKGFAPDYLIKNTGGSHGVEYVRLDRGDTSVRLSPGSVTFGHRPFLGVALSIEEGRGRTWAGRRRGYVETEWHYAAGIHPVTVADLLKAVPHRLVRTDAPKNIYLGQDGQVISRYEYRFIDRSGMERYLDDTDAVVASSFVSAFLAKHIVEASGDLSQYPEFRRTDNEIVAHVLDELTERARFLIGSGYASAAVSAIHSAGEPWKDLTTWYSERLEGVSSVTEALARQYVLQQDIYTPEIVRELDHAVPTTVRIGECVCPVSYIYNAGDSEALDEHAKRDFFALDIDVSSVGYPAIMNISQDSAMQELVRGIPVYDMDACAVTWHAVYAEHVIKAETLTELQEIIEELYCVEQWDAWQRPSFEDVPMDISHPLPDLHLLGVEPILFAYRHDGTPVYAYPTYVSDQYWNTARGEYVSVYRIEYVRTVELAERAMQHVRQIYEAVLAAHQKEVDRETLTVPARIKKDELQPRIDALGREYEARGLSYEEYRAIYAMWQDVYQFLNSYSDSDPRRALELCTEIEGILDEKQKEFSLHEERFGHIPELFDRVLSLKEERASFRFGVLRQQKERIEKELRTASDLLQRRSGQGKSVEQFERALAILQQLESRLMQLREVSDPKQQEFFQALEYDRNASYQRCFEIRGKRLLRATSLDGDDVLRVAENQAGAPLYSVYARENVLIQNDVVNVWNRKYKDVVRAYRLPDGLYVMTSDSRVYEVRGSVEDGFTYVKEVESLSGMLPRTDILYDGNEWVTPKAESAADGFTGAFGALGAVVVGQRKPQKNEEPLPKKELTPGPAVTAAPDISALAKVFGQAPVVAESKRSQPVQDIAPKKTETEETMTDEMRAQLRSELEFMNTIIDSLSRFSRPTKLETKVERALGDIVTKRGELKAQSAAVRTDIESSTRPASVRGKIQALRNAVDTVFKKSVAVALPTTYDAQWLSRYTDALSGIEKAIAANADAQVAIIDLGVEPSNLIAQVRTAIANRLVDLQEGGAIDLNAVVVEVVNQM